MTLQALSRDKEGYLKNPQEWNSVIAEALALEENISLTEAHWQVLHFLREFYANYQISPPMRALVNALKEQYGPDVGNSLHLHRLFPKGPAKQANKIAGLPKPIRCI